MYTVTHMLTPMNVPNRLPGIYIKRLRNSNLVGRLEVLSGRMFFTQRKCLFGGIEETARDY